MEGGLSRDTLLAVLMRHLPGLIFVKDESFRIRAANQAFLDLYPPEKRAEVIGTTTLESYPPEQREKFVEKDREAFERGCSSSLEEVDFPGGDRRVLLTQKVRSEDPESDDLFIVGIATDVTELEAARSRVSELGALVDCSINEVYVLDASTRRFRDVNQRAVFNTGYTRDQLLALDPLELLEGIDPPEFQTHLDALLGGETEAVTLAAQHLRANGTAYDVELQMQHIVRDGVDLIAFLVLDTSELTEYRHQLVRRNEDLLQFAYRTSHDLRAPTLSSHTLLGMAEEYLQAGQVDEAVKVIGTVRRSLSSLLALTEDLVRLARVDQGPIVRLPIDLRRVVEAAVENVSGLAHAAEVDVELVFESAPQIVGDEARLRGVIEGLLSNAIKYRDPVRAARVRLRCCIGAEGDLKLRIEDNGLGVPEDLRDRLFEMFSRLHPRVASGSGLGLHTARRAMRRMGGDIVYKPLSIGSRFDVILPPDASL